MKSQKLLQIYCCFPSQPDTSNLLAPDDVPQVLQALDELVEAHLHHGALSLRQRRLKVTNSIIKINIHPFDPKTPMFFTIRRKSSEQIPSPKSSSHNHFWWEPERFREGSARHLCCCSPGFPWCGSDWCEDCGLWWHAGHRAGAHQCSPAGEDCSQVRRRSTVQSNIHAIERWQNHTLYSQMKPSHVTGGQVKFM